MSGLIGAGADLASTVTTTVTYAALIISLGAIIIGTAYAVLVILEFRELRRKRRQRKAQPVDDAVTKLSRWQDEPPALPNRDPITAEIERWLAEREGQ